MPDWSFGPYVRENFLIHVITAGRGIFRIGDREYRLSEKQMFLIRPGEETFYQADHDEPWSYTWIGFNGYRAESVVKEIGFSPEEPVLTLAETAPISRAIDRILKSRQLTPPADLRRTAAFNEALALMTEHIYRNYTDVRYVNMAIDLISRSYGEKIRISDIAYQIGINRSYLTNIFKREMHMSPQAFLINFRLEKAAQLLKETEDTIGSIAGTVGYSDPLTFSKAFKQKYRMTPSAYRNEEPELALRNERGGYDGTFRL